MVIDIIILQSACCGPVAPIRQDIENAAAMAGVEVNIHQPTDLQEIMKYGTMTFPSLVINGEVYAYDQFETSEGLIKLLTSETASS